MSLDNLLWKGRNFLLPGLAALIFTSCLIDPLHSTAAATRPVLPVTTSTLTLDQTTTPTRTAAYISTYTAKPTLKFLETATGPYRVWTTYVNADYGFSFAAPPDWFVTELTRNFLQVSPASNPTIKLTIGVRRENEDVMIQRTGVPEGDIVLAGKVTFLGQEISKGILQYHGKDKLILYNNCVQIFSGDLVFTLGFSDSNSDYESRDLPDLLVETADHIVGSFALVK